MNESAKTPERPIQSKKRKLSDDADMRKPKAAKTVEEYTQHLRHNNLVFRKEWNRIAEMDTKINDLESQLRILKGERDEKRLNYKEKLENFKKESSPPDGISQPTDLFVQDSDMFWIIMAHLREIEGDDSSHKAFIDHLNISLDCMVDWISGIGKTYAKRIIEARPITDFKQVEAILGKKRAKRIALKFEQKRMFRYTKP
ncbi:Oidioi.mRNA.OKI2018_I69.XSR.g13692.t1.cds [Oikopleura dioica]|uniref:Oidioi.mRNA.OKI2018_I69.XSR.g13692.t1.cds n=1 Tax=Oikopleura dioica TaxID=34765 RepID=A0ABN7S7L1_OIKDI|nr:Oidioi.mRNA.OKI2018_I69.XSR.g13692.t1.cds [Oikopleura dioica]